MTNHVSAVGNRWVLMRRAEGMTAVTIDQRDQPLIFGLMNAMLTHKGSIAIGMALAVLLTIALALSRGLEWKLLKPSNPTTSPTNGSEKS